MLIKLDNWFIISAAYCTSPDTLVKCVDYLLTESHLNLPSILTYEFPPTLLIRQSHGIHNGQA